MRLLALLLSCGLAAHAAVGFRISSFDPGGAISVEDAFTNGVVTLERAENVNGPWLPVGNEFSTGGAVLFQTGFEGANSFLPGVES